MARIISQSPFRRDYQTRRFDPSRATVGSDKWLSPEGVKSAVAITDTVGGVIANTIAKKMDRDAVLDNLEQGKKMAELARLARQEGQGKNVKALQQMILAEGGSLASFGADSKFGDETAGALRKLQQKRATEIFGKGARPEQFNQYDLAQQQEGNILSRGFQGVRALMGDDDRYNEMLAAQARGDRIENQALARRSAAAAYRRAAGAETMAERRAATADAMSAFDRQRAATLTGLAAGQGQQQIAQNLQRLFPSRKPQPRSTGPARMEGLPRDIEKDFARSEDNLKTGNLALAYQQDGYSSTAFRKLSPTEATNGGYPKDTYVPSSQFLPKTVEAKLRSTDPNIRSQGIQEAVSFGAQAVQTANTFGDQLPGMVQKQNQAHGFMAQGKGLTMVGARNEPSVRRFFADPRYQQAIQGFSLTAAPATGGGSGGMPPGAIGQVGPNEFIYPNSQMPGSNQGGSVSATVPSTQVEATAAATERPEALFGSDSDMAAMRGDKPKPKAEPKAESKPKPGSAEAAAALKDFKPRKKKKRSRRRARRKVDAEKLQAQLDEKPRQAAAQRRNQGRTEVRSGAGMTEDRVTPASQRRSEQRLKQELGNARRGRTATPVTRRKQKEEPKATARQVDEAMREYSPKLFSRRSKEGRRNRAKFKRLAYTQGLKVAKAAFKK